jgi:hypothetical protein
MTLSLSSFTINGDPLPDDHFAGSAIFLQQAYLDAGNSPDNSFIAAAEYYDFCVAEGTPNELTDADLE